MSVPLFVQSLFVSSADLPIFITTASSVRTQIQAMLDTYASKYHDLKAPRKLKWKMSLGSVSLSIRVGGDKLDLTVTPLHATIIMHFQVHCPAHLHIQATGY